MRSTSVSALALGLTLLASGCATSSQGQSSPLPLVNVASPVTAGEAGTSGANQSPIFHVLAAESYGRKKQYDEAADHYAVVAMGSDNPGLLERAIQAAIFADRFDLAQTLAKRLSQIDPQSARAAAVMMISALETGDIQAADRALNHWLETDSGNAEQIFNETGQYLQKSVDRDEAIAYTRHLSERFPQQYQAQVVVAKLALSFGELDLAARSAERVLTLGPEKMASYDLGMVVANRRGDIERAIEVLQKAHRRFPDEGRYHSGLIEARIAAGDIQRAASLLEDALSEPPADPKLLRNLALFSYEIERVDLADKALNRLKNIPGQSDQVHLIRGRIALREGDIEAGARALSRVSVKSDQFANAQVLLAAARVEMGDTSGAIAGLKAALNAQGTDEADQQQLMLALASTLAESGRFEESLEVSQQAISAWPDASDFRLQKAMTLFALDKTEAAIKELRVLVEQEPNHAPALNALGYTLADEDRNLDEAAELIGRALQLDPDNPAFMDSLGWLRYRQGKLDRAIDALEQAFRQSPNAEISAHLGEVLWVKGEREKALEVWQDGLEINPRDTTLRRTLRKYAPELLPANGEQ